MSTEETHHGSHHSPRPYPTDAERDFLAPFADDAERFFVAALGNVDGPIVEVGAGDGALAQRLRAHGHEVVAIDVNEDWAQRSTNEGRPVLHADWRSWDGGPHDRYGAAVFSMSLHHIEPVEHAIEQLLRLVPGGVVVVDDFGWERLDELGAHLYMDSAALADAAGLTSRPAPIAAHPLAAWQHRMGEDHPITRGDELIDALHDALTVERVGYGRFIARFLAQHLNPQSAAAEGVRDLLVALEDERISAGSLTPVGLRVVATVPSRTA